MQVGFVTRCWLYNWTELAVGLNLWMWDFYLLLSWKVVWNLAQDIRLIEPNWWCHFRWRKPGMALGWSALFVSACCFYWRQLVCPLLGIHFFLPFSLHLSLFLSRSLASLSLSPSLYLSLSLLPMKGFRMCTFVFCSQLIESSGTNGAFIAKNCSLILFLSICLIAYATTVLWILLTLCNRCSSSTCNILSFTHIAVFCPCCPWTAGLVVHQHLWFILASDSQLATNDDRIFCLNSGIPLQTQWSN